MDPNVSFFEQCQVVPAFGPVALTTARVGDVVSFKGYRRCAIFLWTMVGTAGDDPTITVLQGTDVTLAGSKALNFTRIYTKQDLTKLSDVGQWTKVSQAAGNTYTDLTAAEQETLWGIDIKAEDLDINNDYDCLRVSCSDVGTNTQLGCAFYVLYDPVNEVGGQLMASAIID
jgi:hypothetical protein